MVGALFYPLDIVYKIIDKRPAIFMYGRTGDGRQICVLDRNFKPYFYITLDKDVTLEKVGEKLRSLVADRDEEHYTVTGVSSEKKKFLGKELEVVKVNVNVPNGLPFIKDEALKVGGVERAFEYDISFTKRYMIDKNITILEMLNLDGEYINMKSRVSVFDASAVEHTGEGETFKDFRILALDIETYDPLGKEVVPEKNPIQMLAVYGDGFKEVVTWKKFDTKVDYIKLVDDERALINRFREILNEYKPDLIMGYSSDSFDFPYLISRAKENDVRLDIGLDYSEPNVIRGGTRPVQLTGIIHLDISKFVKRVMSRSPVTESYWLEDIPGKVIMEKEEIDPEEPEKLCTRNLNDASRVFRLGEKILPTMIEFVKIVGVGLFDVNRMGFSRLVEWYLIRQAHNFNELVPPRPESYETSERKKHTYKGSFVYEPIAGLYKDIIVFDYRSLYPTIISSHNICPTTLNCSCCREEAKRAPVEGNYWFCKKKKGFIPSVIGDIVSRRMRIKEILKDKKTSPFLNARQESLKLLANSFYGYLGFFGARWYSIESARAVTAYGRDYIKKVIDKAADEKFSVIYSDTDSIFLTLDGKQKKDALSFSERVNLTLPEMMELEYEGFYPIGIFVSAKETRVGAKKKYALLSDNGSMKIRGFEAVRRNVPFIVKDAQKKVLEIILKKDDTEKAVDYIKKVVSDLHSRKIPLEMVVIYTKLKKDINKYGTIGPHVAAAKRMKGAGINVKAGSIIKYVIVPGSEKIRDRARLPDEVSNYDADYYVNNQLLPSVETIFEVMGYDINKLLEKKEQSRLKKFF